MACRSCGRTLPIIRNGMPTIYAFGPFPDHEEVDYNDLEYDGAIQTTEKAGTTSVDWSNSGVGSDLSGSELRGCDPSDTVEAGVAEESI